MATVATKDRCVTVPTLGLITDFVDGSRLFWASLSPVHERSGYRVSRPDRIQGDAVISAFVNHGPVQVCGSPPLVLPPFVPTLQPPPRRARPPPLLPPIPPPPPASRRPRRGQGVAWQRRRLPRRHGDGQP